MKGVFEATYFKDITLFPDSNLVTFFPYLPKKNMYTNKYFLLCWNGLGRRNSEETSVEILELSCLFGIQLIFTALSLRIYRILEGNI